jgi:hypothetical protein
MTQITAHLAHGPMPIRVYHTMELLAMAYGLTTPPRPAPVHGAERSSPDSRAGRQN